MENVLLETLLRVKLFNYFNEVGGFIVVRSRSLQRHLEARAVRIWLDDSSSNFIAHGTGQLEIALETEPWAAVDTVAGIVGENKNDLSRSAGHDNELIPRGVGEDRSGVSIKVTWFFKVVQRARTLKRSTRKFLGSGST